MKHLVIAVAWILGAAIPGAAQGSEELARRNGCLNCHNVTGKKIGPGLKDVGSRLKSPSDQAKLVEKIAAGKGHPAVKVSTDDLKAIVAWLAS